MKTLLTLFVFIPSFLFAQAIDYEFTSNISCNTAIFNAYHVSGNYAMQFEWFFGDNTDGTGNPIWHDFTANGTYTVTLIVTDGFGNKDTVVHNVTVSSGNFNYTVSTTHVSCKTMELNAKYVSGDTSTQFKWIFGETGPVVTGNPITRTYTQSGNYPVRLVLFDPAGCTDTITAQVSINTTVDYSVTHNVLNCKTAEFTANHTGGDTAAQYVWLFGDNSPVANGNPVTHIFPQNGAYIPRLAVTSLSGCTDTISIPVALTVDINYSVADSGIDCNTAELVAIHEGGDTAAQFLWLFPENETASVNPVTHTFPNTGPNTASLVMINSLGCRDTVNHGFTILYPLSASFSHSPSAPQTNMPIQFNNTSSPDAVKFLWKFDDSTTSTEKDPVKLFTSTGFHRVCLSVVDSNDCSATVCKDVLADVVEIISIPGAFSPNGDGINDVLFVRSFGVASMTLTIYNRWGQKIFASNSLDIGWDGTYNGTVQSEAAFAYVLDATFTSGATVRKQGSVTMLK